MSTIEVQETLTVSHMIAGVIGFYADTGSYATREGRRGHGYNDKAVPMRSANSDKHLYLYITTWSFLPFVGRDVFLSLVTCNITVETMQYCLLVVVILLLLRWLVLLSLSLKIKIFISKAFSELLFAFSLLFAILKHAFPA